jgi:hypothetical protein
MTDIVERLDTFDWWSFEPGAAIYAEAKLRRDAKAELEWLRKVCKDQAGVELSEENDRLIDEIERLQAEKGALMAENEELIATLKEPDQVGYWQRKYELADDEIKRLQAERNQFAEQAAMRDNRDADMQELMRTNNELKAEIERLQADFTEISSAAETAR